MSSLAFPREATPRHRALRALFGVCSRHGSDVLLGVGLMAFAAVLLVNLPGSFDVDSWLALVAGRDLWQNGLPHHETLTIMAHGAAWIDQQWLSQLGTYGLFRTGGLAVVGIANVSLIALAVGGAIAGARRLGARPGPVMAMLALCLFMIVPSRQVRTQEFAMPLFVAVAYLLASDSRSPSRRVYWTLPLLILWANLHGSVTMGAMLVVLRGLALAWERRHRLLGAPRELLGPLALALGGPLCLLVTPYGLGVVGYYRTMLFGGTLTHTVSEWQPVTSSPGTAAIFFIIAAIAVWSFGRYASRTTIWERVALLALAAGSISVVRNLLFFGLLALIVIPLSLSGAASSPVSDRVRDSRRGWINAALALGAGAALLLATASLAAKPASAIELHNQRLGVLSAVRSATAADPSLKVLSEDLFADWLLWRDPGLAGRIANDVRLELLTAGQIDRINHVFGVVGQNWKQGARGYRLIVIDRRYVPLAAQAFLHEPGRQVLYDDGARLVILRSAKEAR